MALDKQRLKSKMKERMLNSFKDNFAYIRNTPGYSGVADDWWEKASDTISDIAMDIIDEIVSNADVVKGVPVGPAPIAPIGVTLQNGKIK